MPYYQCSWGAVWKASILTNLLFITARDPTFEDGTFKPTDTKSDMYVDCTLNMLFGISFTAGGSTVSMESDLNTKPEPELKADFQSLKFSEQVEFLLYARQNVKILPAPKIPLTGN